MRFYWKAVLIFLAAGLQIFSFPPLNWYWLSFIFAVPLLVFLNKERRLIFLLAGFFVYRILAGLGIVYFVFDPLMFIASALIFIGLPLSFYFIYKINKELAFISLLILWPFFDYLEAYYTALPNFVMVAGNSLGQSPFLGLASFGGLIGLTVFVIFVNLLVFFGFFYPAKNGISNGIYKKFDKKRFILALIILAAVLLLSWRTSNFFLDKNKNEYFLRQNTKKIALISDDGYLDNVFKKKNFDSLNQLRRSIKLVTNDLFNNLKNKEFDIIVLPEAMIDINFDDSVDQEAFSKFGIANNGILIAEYRKLAANLDKNLIAGITSVQNNKKYNTLLFFDKNGEVVDIFNKKFLTMSGEYWPFGDWRPFYFNSGLKQISKSNPQIAERYGEYAVFNKNNNFSRGKTKSIKIDDVIFAPAICLEIHYPGEIKKRVKMGSDIILNTSSNMWLYGGINHYLNLTNNLRRIESVWLKTPLMVNGRKEPPALITPEGKIIGSDFKTTDKNYNIFIVSVRAE